jgi:hypothetical protein
MTRIFWISSPSSLTWPSCSTPQRKPGTADTAGKNIVDGKTRVASLLCVLARSCDSGRAAVLLIRMNHGGETHPIWEVMIWFSVFSFDDAEFASISEHLPGLRD